MKKITKEGKERVVLNQNARAKTENFNNGCTMTDLLFTHDETLEDKIATVKTAQLVDAGRFETAFKTLMKR